MIDCPNTSFKFSWLYFDVCRLVGWKCLIANFNTLLFVIIDHCRSDVGPDVGFEAVGLIDAKLETVGVWAKTKEDPPATEVSIATS